MEGVRVLYVCVYLHTCGDHRTTSGVSSGPFHLEFQDMVSQDLGLADSAKLMCGPPDPPVCIVLR